MRSSWLSNKILVRVRDEARVRDGDELEVVVWCCCWDERRVM